MLLVSALLLVLAAGGVLAGAVATDQPQWAWLSVLLCAVCAVLLAWQRFRSRRDASSPTRGTTAAEPAGEGGAPAVRESTARSGPAERRPEGPAERTAPLGTRPIWDEEPGDEGTDAAVLLQGDELDVRVLVVDERPRYHLDSCAWLGARPTVPLPLRQARGLGFTPCALCAPNAVLTAKARVARRWFTPNTVGRPQGGSGPHLVHQNPR